MPHRHFDRGLPKKGRGKAQEKSGGQNERRESRQDELLDEALMETFPASDPISVMEID